MKEGNEHDKHRKHRNVLYSLVVILVILQISSFVFLSIQVVKVSNNVENVRLNLTKQFNDALDSYNTQNQANFNDVTKKLASQESSFSQQITMLKTSSGDFSNVINGAVKSVVTVSTDKALGSGFIITNDGYIVTNEHVISGATSISVTTSDSRVIAAKLIGSDKVRDIALLKISGSYDALSLGNSDNLEVGNKVIAIGNPLGLSFTVTEGIVSGLHRTGPNGLSEYIQTDVSLNPGNSGGPLIDTSGNVIGINNFKIGNAESLGFALESNSIKVIVNQLAGGTII
jgi:S1-C subfamily serine protease